LAKLGRGYLSRGKKAEDACFIAMKVKASAFRTR